MGVNERYPDLSPIDQIGSFRVADQELACLHRKKGGLVRSGWSQSLSPALVFQHCVSQGPGPSVEILHHHNPLVVEVQLRVQNGFSVGRYRQALSLTVKGRN